MRLCESEAEISNLFGDTLILLYLIFEIQTPPSPSPRSNLIDWTEKTEGIINHYVICQSEE